MSIKYLLLSFSLLFSLSVAAQLTKEQELRLDSLFYEWNQPHHPGGSIGIVRDGKTIYNKSFGLASLEYLVPNNNGTVYNIASVSKQFTGMAMVLLEERGVISIDDDIRKHLPWVPDFGQTITIRHMLNHTSGLRSLHALLSIAGWRGDDLRTNDDINRFVKDQTELNFDPGSEYLYCNTGFMLLATLVEEKSGEPFAVWMKKNVFDPLEMPDTYVEDRYDRVVKGNATSYYGNPERGFNRAVEYWDYVGSGNMHSTTSDLLQWLGNFTLPKQGWEKAFAKMTEIVPYNNGEPQRYALGMSIADYYGHRRVGHGGAIGGFRAQIQTFPDDNLSIVVLTNFSSANPGGKLASIANEILDITPDPRPEREEKPEKSYTPKASELKDLIGTYYSPELHVYYEILMDKDELKVYHPRHGYMSVTWESNSDLDVDGPLRELAIIKDKKARVTGFKVTNGRVRNLWFEKQ